MVRKMLEASTAHLPRQVCEELGAYVGVTVHRFRYGWLVWVPEAPEDAAAENDVPEELAGLLAYAHEHGCDWVLLDQDADLVEGLPSWTW